MNKNNKNYTNKLVTLFLTFGKIGAFTFGGGYAMIPLIEHEVVLKHHWLTDDEILDIFAIAESTPGVIAVNTATFVGFRIAGFWGSLLATLGVVLPSLITICLISIIYLQFRNNTWVEYAFTGIRIGVLVLITNAFIKFYKKAEKNYFFYIIGITSFFATVLFKINAIYLLLFGLTCGLTSYLISLKRNKKC